MRQNVARPIFYVNWLDFIISNYKIKAPTITYIDETSEEEIVEDQSIIRISSLANRREYVINTPYPCKHIKLNFNFDDDNFDGNSSLLSSNTYFMGAFGHNFADNNASYGLEIKDSQSQILSTAFGESDIAGDVDWNGFNLKQLNGALSNQGEYNIQSISIVISAEEGSLLNGRIELSNFLFGQSYSMPKAPDLSLTLSRDYDGIQKKVSSGGSTLVNYKYMRPPGFGKQGYFERSKSGYPLSLPTRSGRKRWNLGFKFLESTSSTASENIFTQQEVLYSANGQSSSNLYEESSFFGRVIHMTEGGSKPFLFLPDMDNKNNDQWAVCTFNNSKFDFQQTAPGLYDISLDIVESW